MKKKLTAFLLTAAMLCSLMPMAAATSGPDDDTAAGGSDITALLNEVSGEGYTFTTRDQLPEGTEIIVSLLQVQMSETLFQVAIHLAF